MAPSGYLTVVGIESSLVNLGNTYPSLCDLIVLPEKTHEGRVSRAIRISVELRDGKRGVWMIGGMHADFDVSFLQLRHILFPAIWNPSV